MMYSKPIISSLAEGPKEIFKDTKTAITFEPNSKDELANAMIKISKDANLAKELSKKGYDLVNSKYTMEKVAKTLEDSLLEIIEKYI